MVNFICQLHWILGYPEIWLNIISQSICESVLYEISIRIGRLSKAVHPP